MKCGPHAKYVTLRTEECGIAKNIGRTYDVLGDFDVIFASLPCECSVCTDSFVEERFSFELSWHPVPVLCQHRTECCCCRPSSTAAAVRPRSAVWGEWRQSASVPDPVLAACPHQLLLALQLLQAVSSRVQRHQQHHPGAAACPRREREDARLEAQSGRDCESRQRGSLHLVCLQRHWLQQQ